VGRILQAESRFQKGEGFLKKKDWARAHQAFKEAVDLYPEEGEFHSYTGWALYQTSPQDSAVVERAQRAMEEGLKLNPRHDRGYLFLGWLHKGAGRREDAEKQFEKAIQCNPDCAEALRELRLLSEQRELAGGRTRRQG
jgi:tetratricopeptide (TPR) repeat protein